MYYNWKDKTNTEELKIVCNLIRNGELVIFPTETVYGIGGNALDANAVKRLYKVKQRPVDKPISLLVSDIEMIEQVAKDITELEYALIKEFFPGPLTIILNKICYLIFNINTINLIVVKHLVCA